jgi:rhodanese-related sulfurtransferase
MTTSASVRGRVPVKHVPVRTIGRAELRAKLVRGDLFKLVMALPPWAYRAKHIPGSIQVDAPQAAVAALSHDDEIVVYSSCFACPASLVACRLLADGGFRNVRHYAGGVLDWEEAGYPLEGDWVDNPVTAAVIPFGPTRSRHDDHRS